MIEIKCPFKHKECSNFEEIFNDHDSGLTVSGSMNTSHRYFSQIQTQMLTTNISLCDFVVWTPHLMITCSVELNNEFCRFVSMRSEMFFKNVILPELLTRRIMNNITPINTLPSSSNEPDEKIYCYCQKSYREGVTMIGCDNEKCFYQWFHLTCLKRKTIPKGIWYCKDCKPLFE